MFGDDRLYAALEEFIGNHPREDDISLITLRL